MTETKKMIEELKTERLMAEAAARLDMRVQLEAKDEDVTRCCEQIQQLQTENDNLKFAQQLATKSGSLPTFCAHN